MSGAVETARKQVNRVPGSGWGKRLVSHVRKDDLTGLSAEIAYHWIFAIPPVMILLVMMGVVLDEVVEVDVVGQLRTQIDERAPADTASVLNRLVDNAVAEVGGGIASVGVITAALLALWSGSNGIASLMKAFNRAYGIEEGRPYVRKRGVAIGLTLLLVAVLNGAFVLLVYGKRIGGWMADQIGAGSLFEIGWDLLRWPAALGALFLVMGILYYIGPNAKQPLRSIIPGIVTATLLWIVAALLFGVFLQYSNPGSAYGVLGGVIVLLFFFYLTAMILLVGAEVNVVMTERAENARIEPKVAPERSSIDTAREVVPGT